MCTASWLSAAEGYELFFNRDEARARPVATPPRPFALGSVRALAPRDAQAGGSWIATSELGLTLALLNAESAREPGRPESRGLLVLELADAAGIDELARRLSASDLTRFRGFSLLALEPGPDSSTTARPAARARVWRWDGVELALQDARQPLCSSSLGSERAQRERAAALQRLAQGAAWNGELLERFHRSHEPERGPWSACVHRAEVVTHSLCHVRVGARDVRMRYAHGSPCESRFDEPVVLARRPAGHAPDGDGAG